MKEEYINQIKTTISRGELRKAIETASNLVFNDKQINNDLKNWFFSISRVLS